MYNVSESGGPFWLEVGRTIEIDQDIRVVGPARRLDSAQSLAQSDAYVYYEFMPSSVQFYHYKECSMLMIRPKHGLTKGGTMV